METSEKNKKLSIAIVALVVLAMGYIAWQNKIEQRAVLQQRAVDTVGAQPQVAKHIQITTPLNAPLSGDATIAGVARLVYSEGSFPAQLIDSANNVIWQGPAAAQADWMNSNDVPFQLVIPTAGIPNGTYTLKLTQDDPSGEIQPDQLYTISAQVVIQN